MSKEFIKGCCCFWRQHISNVNNQALCLRSIVTSPQDKCHKAFIEIYNFLALFTQILHVVKTIIIFVSFHKFVFEVNFFFFLHSLHFLHTQFKSDKKSTSLFKKYIFFIGLLENYIFFTFSTQNENCIYKFYIQIKNSGKILHKKLFNLHQFTWEFWMFSFLTQLYIVYINSTLFTQILFRVKKN